MLIIKGRATLPGPKVSLLVYPDHLLSQLPSVHRVVSRLILADITLQLPVCIIRQRVWYIIDNRTIEHCHGTLKDDCYTLSGLQSHDRPLSNIDLILLVRAA